MVLLLLSFAPSPVSAADKLRVSNCYIGGAILPLWLAKDAGFYAREGLEVEQIWIQGNPAVSSLVAGEIDLLYCIPHNVIGAIADGEEFESGSVERSEHSRGSGEGDAVGAESFTTESTENTEFGVCVASLYSGLRVFTA